MRRTPKYASLLRICAPCIWSFLLYHPSFDFLRVHQDWNPHLFGQKQILSITSSTHAQRDIIDSFCKRSEPELSIAVFRRLVDLKQQLEGICSIVSENARNIGEAKYQIFGANRVIRRIRKLASGSFEAAVADIDDWEAESQIPVFVSKLLKGGTSNEVKELLGGLKASKKNIVHANQKTPVMLHENVNLYLTSLQKIASIIPLEEICLRERQISGEIIVENLLSIHRILSENKGLLVSINETRSSIYEMRKSVSLSLSEKLGSKIKIDVIRLGDNSWLEYIRECLNKTSWADGIKLDSPIAAIESFGTPHIALLSALDKYYPFDQLSKMRPNNAKDLLSLKILKDMKSTFFKRLHESENDLDDAVIIRMADQDVLKSIEHLSLGQRCVAILSIILLPKTDVPVVIDQPEDDLDNSYIFSDLVSALRESKYWRQLILVTHNPNIPVSGDADKVFVMKSDGVHAWVEKSGSVDSAMIRHHMLQTLEGGHQAFETRRRRYGAYSHKLKGSESVK